MTEAMQRPLIPVCELTLSGHLTVDSLAAGLQDLLERTPGDRLCKLLVDCTAMHDYDVEARTLFVSWMTAHRQRFCAVAVITNKRLWHLVVSAMALASKVALKAFDEPDQGHSWLTAQSDPVVDSARSS